jgi:hypothetical protein
MTNPPPHQNTEGFTEDVLKAILRDLFPEAPDTLDDAIRSEAPSFDPILIRDLLRKAIDAGRHPAHLVLGHAEAEAYRDFIRAEYGDEAPKDLKDSYFLGLHIVEDDTPSKLALAGEKPHDAWNDRLHPLWKGDDPTNPAGQAA